MDGYQFIASIVASIAWPAAVVALLYLSRKQIPHLTKRLLKLNFPGGGAEFAKEVESAAEAAETIERKVPPAIEASKSVNINVQQADQVGFVELASIYPKAAVFQAYKEIEDTYAKHFSHNVISPNGLKLALQDLVVGGYLSKDEYKLFNRLRDVRNRAVHEHYQNMVLEDVLEYKSLCDKFAAGLKGVLESKFPRSEQ